MSKIAILTDSASYLSQEQAQQNNIEMIPIPIIWNEQEYRDIIDLSFDDFYSKLANEKDLPTTSTPSLGVLEQKIDELVAAGYDEVIGIFISSGISSFVNNATTYAEDRTDIKFHVFDAHVTCAGEANMALLAAKMVKDGHDTEEILDALAKLKETTHVRLVVDNLKHLARTGRLSNVASVVGGLLNIKPIIGMDVKAAGTGELSVIEKERTYLKAFKRVQQDVADEIKDVDYTVRGTIIDAHDAEKSAEWVAKFQADFPKMIVDTSIIGPVVGVHTGQGAICIIWAQDWEELAESYNK